MKLVVTLLGLYPYFLMANHCIEPHRMIEERFEYHRPSKNFAQIHHFPSGMFGNTFHGFQGCSLSLIAPNIVATAGHCFHGNTSAVTFDNLDFILPWEGQFFEVEKKLSGAFNATHDYAFYKTKGFPGYIYGWRNIDSSPIAKNKTVVIFQHPMGRPKSLCVGPSLGISDSNKHNKGFGLGGSNEPIERTFLNYQCSTDAYSSGSGVLDKNGHLRAIHTNGGCAHSVELGNSGTLIRDAIQVYPDLKKMLPPKINLDFSKKIALRFAGKYLNRDGTLSEKPFHWNLKNFNDGTIGLFYGRVIRRFWLHVDENNRISAKKVAKSSNIRIRLLPLSFPGGRLILRTALKPTAPGWISPSEEKAVSTRVAAKGWVYEQ